MEAWREGAYASPRWIYCVLLHDVYLHDVCFATTSALEGV